MYHLFKYSVIVIIIIKWIAVTFIIRTPLEMQALIGSMFSYSLGGSIANAWYWRISSFFIDVFALIAINGHFSQNDDPAPAPALFYFVFNTAAAFNAQYGSGDIVGIPASDLGNIISFLATGPFFIVIGTMTAWFSVLIYIATRLSRRDN